MYGTIVMSPKITPAKALRIDNCFKSSKFIVLTPPPNPLPQGAGENTLFC